jgi:hypothetical protein
MRWAYRYSHATIVQANRPETAFGGPHVEDCSCRKRQYDRRFVN